MSARETIRLMGGQVSEPLSCWAVGCAVDAAVGAAVDAAVGAVVGVAADSAVGGAVGTVLGATSVSSTYRSSFGGERMMSGKAPTDKLMLFWMGFLKSLPTAMNVGTCAFRQMCRRSTPNRLDTSTRAANLLSAHASRRTRALVCASQHQREGALPEITAESRRVSSPQCHLC